MKVYIYKMVITRPYFSYRTSCLVTRLRIEYLMTMEVHKVEMPLERFQRETSRTHKWLCPMEKDTHNCWLGRAFIKYQGLSVTSLVLLSCCVLLNAADSSPGRLSRAPFSQASVTSLERRSWSSFTSLPLLLLEQKHHLLKQQ